MRDEYSNPQEFDSDSLRTAPFHESDLVMELASGISAKAVELDSARRMPADMAKQLARAGLFRLLTPKFLGGVELHPIRYFRVIEEVSRADGSAGWCTMIGSVAALMAGLLTEKAAREIFADPDVITGGAVAPSGKATPVDGGFLVSGRWQWGSGTQNCAWISASSLIIENGAPRLHPNGEPQIKLTYFPAEKVEIPDTWHAVGLRGTGSHDFIVKDVFVPTDYTVPIPDSPVFVDRPLYRLPLLSMFGVAVCAVSVGIARRAIDEFVELARTKTPTLERRALRTSPRVHEAVARAEAAVGSARAFVFDALEAAWRSALDGKRIPIEIRRHMRLAASNATWQSAHAVDLMYNAAGGSAVHDASVLQRCLRDAHVISQHASVNMTVQEQAGHAYLDPAVDYPFL
jgi:indole-3-acetate monooxygenase